MLNVANTFMIDLSSNHLSGSITTLRDSVAG
jgi:hypothetical protein